MTKRRIKLHGASVVMDQIGGSGSNFFFFFKQFLAKILTSNRSPPPISWVVDPPIWEILDLPLGWVCTLLYFLF